MNDLHWTTLVEAAGNITARKLSPFELMSALLERIGRLDPKLNVFIRLRDKSFHASARSVLSYRSSVVVSKTGQRARAART